MIVYLLFEVYTYDERTPNKETPIASFTNLDEALERQVELMLENRVDAISYSVREHQVKL